MRIDFVTRPRYKTKVRQRKELSLRFFTVVMAEERAIYQLMKADKERHRYERTNPTLKEMLRWV